MRNVTRPAVESQIRELLVSHLGVSAETLAQHADDAPLLGQGIGLDSIEAMTRASELESTFLIRFEDHELTLELFHSIGSLANAVTAKCSAPQEAGQS